MINKNEEVNADKMAHLLGSKAGIFAKSAQVYIKIGKDYVSDNPGKGITIATLAGAIIGSILTKKLQKNWLITMQNLR